MKVMTEEKLNTAIEMYLNDKTMTLAKVAESIGVSLSALQREFTKRKVPTRTTGRKRGITEETSLKQQLFSFFNAGDEDPDKVARKVGCSVTYARTVYQHWKGMQAEAFKEKLANTAIDINKYLTVSKLEDFKNSVQIGDRIIMRGQTDNGSNSYLFDAPRGRKVTVTVLQKYPSFAMTDHGAKLWIDLWDAVKRYRQP